MIDCLTFQKSGLTEEEWDNYILKGDNGTLFHKKSFLGYHLRKEIKDASLVFRKKGKIIALLPGAIQESKKGKIYSSHYGASWGGLVYQNPLNFADCKEICLSLLSFSEKMGYHGIEITLPPTIYQRTSSDYIPFMFLQHGFRYKKRELTNIICFNNDIKIPDSFDRSVRWGAGKSKRMEIKIIKDSDDYSSFYELMEKSLEDKATTPTHSLEELLNLKKLFPKDIILWTAHKDNQLVGGMCNWQVQPGIWLIFYSAYLSGLSSYRILNRLYYEGITEYYNTGCRYVDFGTSSINMQVNEGLIAFKEQFLAYGVFRDTLIYDIPANR